MIPLAASKERNLSHPWDSSVKKIKIIKIAVAIIHQLRHHVLRKTKGKTLKKKGKMMKKIIVEEKAILEEIRL